MGFLDRQSRVIDVILTERGRRLYAAGRLDFAFFGLFDDGLDYDPWSTGSLTDAEREGQVEATPMLEAPFVREVRAATAPLEPIDHIYTAAPGFVTVPSMAAPLDGDGLSLMADQRRDGETYRRAGTSLAQINPRVIGDAERGNPGFIVRVFLSGSHGIQELDLRRDLSGRRAYDPFIALSIDDESPLDRPEVRRPDSSRSAVDRMTPRKR